MIALVGLAALVAACGSGGAGDGAQSSNTIDANLQSGVKEALVASTTVPDVPKTIEDWEALWASQRAAIVERIRTNGWGKSADGTKVSGPEGYTVDLTKCPAGWSDTEGLTDTTIKVGHTGPQSGPVADAGQIMAVLNALFAHHNARGGFTDSEGKTRRAEVVLRDDGYDPARTIPLIDELLDSERVFAIGTVGTPNQVKVYDKIDARCVPYPAVSGHNSVGDPVGHPWTISSSISYTSEALLVGQFVEERLDREFGGKAKVAVLFTANDFGTAFDQGFKAFLAGSPRQGDIEYVTQVAEPGASTVKDQMTTLAAEEPDVFVAALAGAACAQVVTEASENGMKEAVRYKMLNSACKGSSIRPATMGGAADGWYAVSGGYLDIASASADGDPWMTYARSVLAESGLDYKASSAFNTGFFYMWPWIQALLIAGELDGGLTRTNFNLAWRTMDMTHPHLYPGVNYNMNGNADAFFVEGSDFSRWSDAAGSWELITVVDVSGKTKNCRWNAATASCG